MLKNLFFNKKNNDNDNIYILNNNENISSVEYYLYPVTTGCLEYNDILIDILTTLLNNLFVVMYIIKRPINKEVDCMFFDEFRNNFVAYDKNIIGKKNEIYISSKGLNTEVLYYMFKKEIYNSDIKIYAKNKHYIDLNKYTKEDFNNISDIIIEIGKNEDYIKIIQKKGFNSGLDELYLRNVLKKYFKKLEIDGSI